MVYTKHNCVVICTVYTCTRTSNIHVSVSTNFSTPLWLFGFSDCGFLKARVCEYNWLLCPRNYTHKIDTQQPIINTQMQQFIKSHRESRVRWRTGVGMEDGDLALKHCLIIFGRVLLYLLHNMLLFYKKIFFG